MIKHGEARRIPSPLRFVAGLAWHAHRLYVSGAALTPKGPSWRLVAWGGWDGNTFTKRHTIYTAPMGFGGFNGIDFGTNGRLYVGADVGLIDGNDHGPRSTSPFVYDMLTFRADGTDGRSSRKASASRGRWRSSTVRTRRSSPISVRIREPRTRPTSSCTSDGARTTASRSATHTKPGPCAGSAIPFRQFGPHTDLMGIAIRGPKFYLTSFLGRQGKGPGGEVFSLGIKAGTLKPLITGFVAPTVGSAHARRLPLRRRADRAGVPPEGLTT